MNIQEKWMPAKLIDITIKIGSGATPRGGKESYQKSGISLIRSLNVFDLKFATKDLAFIDDAQAKQLENVTVVRVGFSPSIVKSLKSCELSIVTLPQIVIRLKPLLVAMVFASARLSTG